MATFLGYALFDNLDAFYTWQGKDINPADGTVNKSLNYCKGNCATRYTRPIAHPDSDYGFDEEGIPFVEPAGFWASMGKLFTNPDRRVICMITDACPQTLKPATLYTKADMQDMGFIAKTFY